MSRLTQVFCSQILDNAGRVILEQASRGWHMPTPEMRLERAAPGPRPKANRRHQTQQRGAKRVRRAIHRCGPGSEGRSAEAPEDGCGQRRQWQGSELRGAGVSKNRSRMWTKNEWEKIRETGARKHGWWYQPGKLRLVAAAPRPSGTPPTALAPGVRGAASEGHRRSLVPGSLLAFCRMRAFSCQPTPRRSDNRPRRRR